jgi:hypothetical protein
MSNWPYQTLKVANTDFTGNPSRTRNIKLGNRPYTEVSLNHTQKNKFSLSQLH